LTLGAASKIMPKKPTGNSNAQDALRAVWIWDSE
jgi:hypothetical protein